MIALIRQFVECESPSDDPAAVNRFVELVADTVAPLAKVKTMRGGTVRPAPRVRNDAARAEERAGRFWRSATPTRSGRRARCATMPFRQSRRAAVGAGRAGHEGGHRVFPFRGARAARAGASRCLAKCCCSSIRMRRWAANRSRAADGEERGPQQGGAGAGAGHGPRRQAEDGAQGRGRLHGDGARQGVARGRGFRRPGASAVVELARQIERIAGFTRLERGITVNPGVIAGGTRTNVVAAEARAEVDIRVVRLRDAPALGAEVPRPAAGGPALHASR